MQIINLQYAPTAVSPVVHVSQNDIGRQFQLKLYDGSTPFTMPNGTTARIDGIKPDKKGFSYPDAVSVSGNVVTVTTKQQMTIVAGEVVCEIRFSLNSNDIGTLNFKMIVEPSPINEDTDISETDLPAIIELGRENMLNSEAWAKGTKDGVAVSSTDPQYHNNSKYWNEQTQTIANESEAWAVGTKNGVAVQSTDPQYHNNSRYWNDETNLDGEAWTKGTRGGTPVSSGDPTYHNNAKFYADEAESHADDSEAWAIGERDGVPVSSGDETYQNNSKYWSDNAASILSSTAASLIATCQNWADVAKAWAVGPSGSGTGTDTNNSKYWSQQSYSYLEQIIIEAQTLNSIIALIHLLFSSVYLDAENGDRLITESGDNIIIDY